MRHEWLVVGLSLSAALAFALSSTLKHVSAGDAPDAQNLHPGKLRGFVIATLSHRLWLGGIAFDVVGLALQILALHLGALALVQPLLISSLLFALVLRQRFEHQPITRRQVSWALALSGALTGLIVLATRGMSGGPNDAADVAPAVVSGVVGAVLAVVCVERSRGQRIDGHSAALMGIAVGVIYAATAALLKGLADIFVRSPPQVLLSWQLYAVIVLGAAGLLLNQLAFQAGPITASLPATATVDPLLSIVIGVFVYDEHINTGPGRGAAFVGLIVLLGVAVIQLTRSNPAPESE